MRFFNTAGPCEPSRHYMLPAAPRLPDAERLFEQGAYLALHAPRQSGKTTTLRVLAKQVTAQGRYTALYLCCKVAECALGEPEASQLVILGEVRAQAAIHLSAELPPPSWPEVCALNLLGSGLRAWAQVSPRPLILFFDEFDALTGPALRSVLAQLHAGFPERPQQAPWSVVLCGLRDIHDYRLADSQEPERIGAVSPPATPLSAGFNITASSVRLANFSAAEVAALYAQHHADTGQAFSDEAVQHAFALTSGQPWLVNALAREVITKMKITEPVISAEHIDRAKERLIQERPTHLDTLAVRLREDRVRHVLMPVIAGAPHISSRYNEDVRYAQDLGLLALDRPLRVQNPIYRELIARRPRRFRSASPWRTKRPPRAARSTCCAPETTWPRCHGACQTLGGVSPLGGRVLWGLSARTKCGNMARMKIILTGATGMVGEGVLLECLDNPKVERVLSVSRRSCGRTHEKLNELLVPDFRDVSAVREQLRGYDACLYCAGISSVGLSEAQYTEITYDTPLRFAEALLALNPGMVLCHLSGASTDSTEAGKTMWARVKGRAENALSRLPFKGVVHFRPGLMKPTAGQRSVKGIFRAALVLYPVMNLFLTGLTMTEVGRAMLNAAEGKADKNVLEAADMKALAAR